MKKSGNFSVVGIIAEYNPFHNGHAYHIAKAKELSGAEACVVVMSGDFVQRGAPAVYDKYIRTAMALKSGADLVLEMPARFAASSAEDFAACGVALLRHLTVVSHLCFGSECGDMHLLSQVSDILAREPAVYTETLKEGLRQGLTFPEAREQAVIEYLETSGNEAGSNEPLIESLRQVLGSPNNILGLEYCKALNRQNCNITPLTIQRAGSGYHDTEMTDCFASATGIRKTLQEMQNGQLLQAFPSSQQTPPALPLRSPDWYQTLKNQVPEDVLTALTDCRPLFAEDFSALLNASLLNLVHSGARLSDYADVSEELEARLSSMLLEFGSWEERIQRLKTRQYTYTRVSRALLHLMLGIKKTDMEAGRALDYAPYARVLGFKRDSTGLLTQIKARSDIPLITKTADAENILTPAAYTMLQQDFHCSHLYDAVWNGRYQQPLPNEFSRQIVIL